MPKVKLGRKETREQPPIDWLWAAVLERRMALKVSIKDMAEIANVSYGTMRNYAAKSPWDWPRQMRENVCSAFGINVSVSPTSNGLEVIAG